MLRTALLLFLLILSFASCRSYNDDDLAEIVAQRHSRYYRSFPDTRDMKRRMFSRLVDFMNDAGRLRFGR